MRDCITCAHCPTFPWVQATDASIIVGYCFQAKRLCRMRLNHLHVYERVKVGIGGWVKADPCGHYIRG
ncbi:hypothetical protein LJC36_00055 [Desulfovibrio sp. OttesenSCG-928-C14]|nr:hypothetical protein [Desulfovibrio sp. OttesenSCG-928-C14]